MNKTNFLCFIIFFLFIFSACDIFNDDEDIFTFIPNAFELKVFELTNIERTNHGLPPLIWHNDLAVAARGHSEDLMRNNLTGHVGSDGSNVGQRIERAGITNWRTWAENCAYGYSTPEATVAAWMNSSGHRANILRTNVTHLGVGFVPRAQDVTARFQTYWTQKFCAFR